MTPKAIQEITKTVLMQIQSVETIPNFLVANKSHDVVLPFLWQYSMNLSYPSASLASKEPSSLKRLNLANITIDPAARSWPNPRWNTCIVSGSILLARSKPGIWHKGTGPGLKADAQAAAPMVPRHLAVESITCQSCARLTFWVEDWKRCFDQSWAPGADLQRRAEELLKEAKIQIRSWLAPSSPKTKSRSTTRRASCSFAAHDANGCQFCPATRWAHCARRRWRIQTGRRVCKHTP